MKICNQPKWLIKTVSIKICGIFLLIIMFSNPIFAQEADSVSLGWISIKSQDNIHVYYMMDSCEDKSLLLFKVRNDDLRKANISWNLKIDLTESSQTFFFQPFDLGANSEIIGSCNDPNDKLSFRPPAIEEGDSILAVTLSPLIFFQ